MNIQDIRKQYPEYSDLTDKQIADGFHEKYYSDVPINEFYISIGLTDPTEPTRQEKEKDLLKSLASVVPIAASYIGGIPGDLERLSTYLQPEKKRIIKSRQPGRQTAGFDYSRFAPETLGKSATNKYLFPGSAQLRGMMTQLAPRAEEIIDYQPTTAPGRYAQTIGTFAAPGILGKTQAARKFGTAIGAGGGGLFQGLQDVSGSPGLATGITLPAMVGAGILGGPSTAARLAQTSLKNVSKSDISQAQALERTANQLGIKLLPGESMKDKAVQSLTADIIASEKGSPFIYEATKGRPAAVGAAVETQASKIGPPPKSMRESNQLVAETAREAKKQARKIRTSEAQSAGYGALPNATIKPEQVQKVINKINQEIKSLPVGSPSIKVLKDLRQRITIPVKPPPKTPQILGPSGRPIKPIETPKKFKPQTNINKLDKAFQEFRKRSELPPFSENAIDKNLWYKMFNAENDGILNILNNEMRTNANYARANDVFADLSNRLVKVVDANVDSLAKNKISESIIKGFVFNPNKANALDIRRTYEALNKSNPAAFPELANVYFRNAADKAFALVKQGEDLTQGFNLAKAVVGTGNQRKNFMAVLEGVAKAKKVNPQQLKVGFERLFDVLERTGKVTNINKPGFHAQGAAARTLIKDAAMMKTFNPFVRLATKYGELKAGGAERTLGRIMASDDAINQLIMLAKTDPQSKLAIRRAVNIIDASQATQDWLDPTNQLTQ